MRLGSAVAAFLLVLAHTAVGGDTAAAPPVRTTRLAEGLYALTAFGGNPVGSTLLALVGSDGILLVDTAYDRTAADVLAELRRLSPAPIRTVINTHVHDDHIGGNELLAPGATVVAHENVRVRLTSGIARLTPRPQHVLPGVTFTGTMTVYFAGEEVRLVHVPAAHTDGDIVVHFVRAGVVAVGDLLFPNLFPYIGTGLGGTWPGYMEALAALAGMAPEGTRFVPAHGAILTTSEVRIQHRELLAAERAVHAARSAGASWTELRAGKVLENWASWATGWVTADRFLDLLEATERGASSQSRPSIVDPLVEVLVAGKGDAAVQRYRQLKGQCPADYSCAEEDLNQLGYALLQLGRTADAAAIFQLNVEEHPDSWNAHDSLGEALAAAGQENAAIASYERSVALNPGNSNGLQALERLRRR